MKILIILLMSLVSLNVLSQENTEKDQYVKHVRVVKIIEGQRSVHISAVDSNYPTDTLEYISFQDTIYSRETHRPLNHFWSGHNRVMTFKVGDSYPIFTFKIPYYYIPEIGYIIMSKGKIISIIKDKDKIPVGIANSFGWTLQEWTLIYFTHDCN